MENQSLFWIIVHPRKVQLEEKVCCIFLWSNKQANQTNRYWVYEWNQLELWKNLKLKERSYWNTGKLGKLKMHPRRCNGIQYCLKRKNGRKKKLPKRVKSSKVKKVLSCKRKMGRKPISNMASDKSCRQEITPEKHREVMLPKGEYRRLL